MVIITTKQSLVAARKILDEIAIEGRYVLDSTSTTGVVYKKDGTRIFINRLSHNQYQVVKEVETETPVVGRGTE